jgi:wobble nucleotide-excising tRNase
MIKKINKIKKFGLFDDFNWSTDLPEFKRFNILYGWNWTGKTTLSRVFQCYEHGSIDKDFPSSEFEIELNDGAKLNQQNLDHDLKIRVFNKLFIEENISWEGSAQPIYFIGKKNIALQEELEKLSAKEKALGIEIIKLKENLQTKKKEKGKLAWSIGKNIKDNLTTNLNDKYRLYDKTNFFNFIQNKKAELKNPKNLELSESDYKKLKQSISKERMDPIPEIPEIKLEGEKFITRANDLMSKSIISNSIEKLTKDWIINNWVREGLDIHKNRESKICEFCGQKLPTGLISRFEAHFNDEYNKFIQSIKTLTSQIESQKIKPNLPDSSRIYSDFQKEFSAAKTTNTKAVQDANIELDKIKNKLSEKIKNPFKESTIGESEVDLKKFDQLNNAFKSLNQIIKKHNSLTHNFDSEITKNKAKLEAHFIAEVIDEYNRIEADIKNTDNEIKRKDQEARKYKEEITEKEKDLLDHRVPADTINDLLKVYFGREEIKLEVAGDGYYIKRNNDVAKNLSEGEKTAIAFSYFITKLREKDFDLCNGVVVIDDPVSSLDSNALFQAFAFMKNSCKDAGQLLIFTHNFDFFRQVKNWFDYTGKKNFYMVTNSLDKNRNRIAKISKIDQLLVDYDSEYHYLFSLLYRYSKLNDQDLEKVYNLPNIARKFIECFLAFKIPKKETLHKKIENLNFNKDKQTKINRFIQTHSHLKNEDGIINFDMSILSETSQVIKDILDLIDHEDKRHYESLCESIQ